MILYHAKESLYRFRMRWYDKKFRQRVKRWTYMVGAGLTFTHCYATYRFPAYVNGKVVDSPVVTSMMAAGAGLVWPLYGLAHAAPMIWGAPPADCE